MGAHLTRQQVSDVVDPLGWRLILGAAITHAPVPSLGAAALDIPLVRPFWQAVTGYVDEPGPPDLPDGALLSAEAAPAFWMLADPEGNEVCVCTWQGRD